MRGHVGIDVGGTFTDAVLINDGVLETKAKVPTAPENLLQTILGALDCLGINAEKSLERITVSTTLITNAILQGRLPPVELCLLPGSGMKLGALAWPVPYQILSGEMDYKGREVIPPNELEWRRFIEKTVNKDKAHYIAIIGKFSHRNNSHEEQLAAYFRQFAPDSEIALGHHWGQADFFRRSLTTYLNLASKDLFTQFAKGLEQAVAERGCSAPIVVLKADGGVLPLSKIRPIETIYSGPTASVLGGLAQNDASSFVIVDIGGTTTDLGIVLSNAPLLSSRGAMIGSYATLVRSLAVRSVPVGGDSVVLLDNEHLSLADYRLGPAYCFGGPAPTPTDAMLYLGFANHGNPKRAEAALAALLPSGKRNPTEIHHLAISILQVMADRIACEIESMEKEWQEEPAYKIWGVLHPHEALNLHIWASGGGAHGLKSFLEDRLHTEVRLGKYPEVSNAIGAAMARPTFSCTLHLDTVLKRFQIEETGEQGDWKGSKLPYQEVDAFLDLVASRIASEQGTNLSEAQKEPFDFFPIVQGYRTVGQIVRGSLRVPPGVRGRIF
ncbi:MAG: hydantoinase/oxoprolinase family protein [Desulfitobacteriaceae bacterium]